MGELRCLAFHTDVRRNVKEINGGMTFFWGNSRLANSTQHSSVTLKKSARKLPTCSVQRAVKVNSNCRGRGGGVLLLKGERENGRESKRNRF
jgi:hypothetical protein